MNLPLFKFSASYAAHSESQKKKILKIGQELQMRTMMTIGMSYASPSSEITFRNAGNFDMQGFMNYGCYCWPTEEQFRDGSWHGQETVKFDNC